MSFLMCRSALVGGFSPGSRGGTWSYSPDSPGSGRGDNDVSGQDLGGPFYRVPVPGEPVLAPSFQLMLDHDLQRIAYER